jgi:hypothetical protein
MGGRIVLEDTMNVALSSIPTQRRNVLLAILVGGGIAGSLDIITAFILYGWSVPRGIASGLLGQRSLDGGVGPWILGVFLHFFIAFSAAAIFCFSSRRLEFLRDHFILCGLFFGIAVFLVMNLIVIPLSAIPNKRGTFTVAGLTQGLLIHMLVIGLPISFSARIFSK